MKARDTFIEIWGDERHNVIEHYRNLGYESMRFPSMTMTPIPDPPNTPEGVIYELNVLLYVSQCWNKIHPILWAYLTTLKGMGLYISLFI